MKIERAEVATPVGPFVVFTRGDALCAAIFADGEEGIRAWLARRFDDVAPVRGAERARRALDAYVQGDVHAVDALQVDTGGTPFQQRVWAALREIPAGATWSYTQLAAHIDAPYAVRAVGAANGRNPVSIVVPCHRVIAADGTLCGYGGGLHRKRWLLEHEGAAFKGRLAA